MIKELILQDESLVVPWRVTGASLSADGSLCAMIGERGDDEYVLRVWDVKANLERFTTVGGNVVPGRYDISFSPDGEKLAIFDSFDSYIPTLVSVAYTRKAIVLPCPRII